ncbi:MAG TPA: PepSY domain-containing protein [Rickettsiales bacterium]|nr:PepSY domain-containing protein [Rickettsiales bacterium]
MRYNPAITATLSCFAFAASAMALPNVTHIVHNDLHAAVLAALAHTPGQVLEADQERGEENYEIDIVHDHQITEVEVDAETGKVVEAKTDEIKHRIKAFFISDKKIAALKAAKISMPDAIAKAEDSTHARAISAEFEREDEQYVYEIKLEADGKRIKARVNANTGHMESREH